MNQDRSMFRRGVSLWSSLELVTTAIEAIACLCSLPAQLLLHRDLGRAYINTITVWLSLMLFALIASAPSLANLTSSKTATWSSYEAPRSLLGSPSSPLPSPKDTFGLETVILAAMVGAYCCHRLRCWRQFRTTAMQHSLNFGAPWWLYLTPFERASQPSMPSMPPASASIIKDSLAMLRYHLRLFLASRARGGVPAGMVVWIVVSLLQPVVLFALGLSLLNAGRLGLGLYCAAAGLGMALQCTIYKARLVQRVYDRNDHRLEQEAFEAIADPQASARAERSGLKLAALVTPVNQRRESA